MTLTRTSTVNTPPARGRNLLLRTRNQRVIPERFGVLSRCLPWGHSPKWSPRRSCPTGGWRHSGARTTQTDKALIYGAVMSQ